MYEVLWLSVITASIAFTLTETRLFAPVRNWVSGKSKFMEKLVHCGYCTGHWVAFALEAVYQPRLFNMAPFLDYFLTALAIAWLAGLQWVFMCWLMKKAGK